MSHRRIDVVYVGADPRRYALIQRFAGESTRVWASVQWLRDPGDLLDAERPTEPTIWLLSAAHAPEPLRAAVRHLESLGLESAAAILAALDDAVPPRELRALLPDAMRVLDPTRLTVGSFERLLTDLARAPRSGRKRM